MSSHVADLMVRGNDILGDFVRAAQADTALPADHGADILAQLAALTGAAVPVSAKKPAAIASAPPPTAEKTFIIHFQPSPDMLRTGNEPLLMLRELGGLGRMSVVADTNGLPTLTEMDALRSYLSWTCTLVTNRDRDAIDEVFEFVAGDTAQVIVEEEGAAAVIPPQGEEGDGWGLFAPPAANPDTGEEGDGWGLFAPLPGTAKPVEATPKPAAATPPPIRPMPRRRAATPSIPRRSASIWTRSTVWSTWWANWSSPRPCWANRPAASPSNPTRN